MKKILALLLAISMICSIALFSGCDKSDEGDPTLTIQNVINSYDIDPVIELKLTGARFVSDKDKILPALCGSLRELEIEEVEKVNKHEINIHTKG